MYRLFGIALILLLSGCSIFKNIRKDRERRKSDLHELTWSDQSDSTWLRSWERMEIDIRLPSRTYNLDIPKVGPSWIYNGQLFSVILELDTLTDRLQGAFHLPDTLIKGMSERAVEIKGGVSNREGSERKEKSSKDVQSEDSSVSWKTIVLGVVIALIMGVIIYLKWPDIRLRLK